MHGRHRQVANAAGADLVARQCGMAGKGKGYLKKKKPLAISLLCDALATLRGHSVIGTNLNSSDEID